MNKSTDFEYRWQIRFQMALRPHPHCRQRIAEINCDPIDRQPAGHAYFDTHVDWIDFNDDLPRTGDPDLGK